MDDAAPDANETRAVYRLIHEVCELGADARAWREHFQAGILALVDATTAIGYVLRLGLDPGAVKPAVELDVETGTNEAWRKYLARGDLTTNPMTPPIMARFGTDFTCARHDLVDDPTWYDSDYFTQVCIPCGWDHTVISQVCIDPPGVIDGFGLCRPHGRPPFDRRAVAIVRLAHQELAHLWRKPDPLGVNRLPTRLRQTLHCIRRGLARKEIAARLGISAHTAHLYEKTLYAKYHVAGRGELTALLASSIRPTLLPLEPDNEFFDEPNTPAHPAAPTPHPLPPANRRPPDAIRPDH